MTNAVSATTLRVRYAETDQMGVAHHANYLIWCEQARTDHMRALGVNYRELEASGVRLPVVEASLRYRRPARYDDELQVQCWVREVSSRMVTFGYAIVVGEDVVATATTTLAAVDEAQMVRRLPMSIREKLVVTSDPIRV